MATFLRARCTLQLVGQSTPCLITTYWDSAGATPTVLGTEALARVRAMFNGLAASIVTGAGLTFNPIVDEIEETTGTLVNQHAATPPASVTFSATGDALPYATQALARFGTAGFINGRRVQGRMFIPGFVESQSLGTPPQPTGGLIGILQTSVNLLGTTVTTPMSQRIWHRPGPSGAGLSVPVTARSISPFWATLRSRRT